ncbi:hypothetical protein QJS10_CPB13g00302 [Acorus calamus]|uniref:PB1 domain-containing protein n=1 Tax=Acorus calamus TaxID=4465 RepID=A0AAV9DFF2_ACOCL|nr:hypothetical protein QJS10_CPB13g00302 [Acorus calamus]
MENYSYSSYPDSHDSSPRSREIDYDNGSSAWDDQSAPPSGGGAPSRVKFMCSYGGKIQPRQHDNQLSYFGGETKILAVDRSARFAAVLSKLSSLCGIGDLTFFKYQLPGEDLDALISVTNDEDLDHMMIEYDRLHRSSPKPSRLRLFLFPPSPAPTAAAPPPTKPDREWFVEALNAVPPPPPQPQTIDSSAAASPASAPNPDFLFGLDKAEVKEPVAVEVAQAEIAVPDRARNDRAVEAAAAAAASSGEIQRQIQELQRLQILANQEQAAFQQGKSDEAASRVLQAGEYYLPPKILENPSPLPPAAAAAQVPATYWHDHQVATAAAGGGYPSMVGSDQPMYLISVPTGRPMTGGPSQGYYIYREQPPMYGTAGPKLSPQYAVAGDMNVVGGAPTGRTVVTDAGGFAQVAYGGAGRPVYYTAAPVATYPTMAAAAAMAASPNPTPEGKKAPQAS